MKYLEDRVGDLEREVQALKSLLGNGTVGLSGHPSLESVLNRVCAEYNVPPSKILGRDKHQSVNKPRSIAMWLASQVTQFNRNEQAKFFGKNHGTVCYAIRTVSDRRETEKAYKAETDALLAQFKP